MASCPTSPRCRSWCSRSVQAPVHLTLGLCQADELLVRPGERRRRVRARFEDAGRRHPCSDLVEGQVSEMERGEPCRAPQVDVHGIGYLMDRTADDVGVDLAPQVRCCLLYTSP